MSQKKSKVATIELRNGLRMGDKKKHGIYERYAPLVESLKAYLKEQLDDPDEKLLTKLNEKAQQDRGYKFSDLEVDFVVKKGKKKVKKLKKNQPTTRSKK